MSGSERTFSRRDRAIIAGVALLLFAVALSGVSIWVLHSVSSLIGVLLLCCSVLDAIVGLRFVAGSFTVLLAIAMIAVGIVGFCVGLMNIPGAVRPLEREGFVTANAEKSKDWAGADAAKAERERHCPLACGVFTVALVPIGIWLIVRKGRERLEKEFLPDAQG